MGHRDGGGADSCDWCLSKPAGPSDTISHGGTPIGDRAAILTAVNADGNAAHTTSDADAYSMNLSQDIFREYDIRGVTGKDLTPEVATIIARAFAAFLKEQNVQRNNRCRPR